MLVVEKGNKKRRQQVVLLETRPVINPITQQFVILVMRWKPVLARCLDGSGDFPLYTSSCLCLASCIKRRFLTHGATRTQQRAELQMALTLSTKLL